MKDIYRILVINPGSTSTKVAYYENEKAVCEKNLDIDHSLIANMKGIFDQYDLRRSTIQKFMEEEQINQSDLDVIVSRGGGGGNLMSGAYRIEENLVEHCHNFAIPHASSLGPVIAYDMGKELGIPAFIYDGEGVNEFCALATLSGLKEFPIAPGSHTLNAKAAARIGAEKLGGGLADFNLVVCHLGGGTSTSAHQHGRLIDSTSDGYAAERAGGMPFLAITGFIKGCYSGVYDQTDMMKLFMGKGGLMSYLGTSDLREVEKRMDAGDEDARFYFDGLVYQQAKDIGAMATVLNMAVDAIVLTGGMAYSKRLVEELAKRTEKIAPIIVAAGSHEMDSLASGALRVIRKEEKYHLFGKSEAEDRYIGE
ncbi:butyrate kinase [Oscillibacter sp. GMB15532]|uniref:butyrate kinase n=1 Tax=Oscillibacter sp. GMB15532 TaxID=3230022 RepID=UPI0034DF79F5